MDFQTIGKFLAEIAILLFCGAVAYLSPSAKDWLKTFVGEKKANNLCTLIERFVASAEQTITGGELKKAYVCQRLVEIGIEVTKQVDAYIESAVYKLHHKETEAEQ